MVMPAANFVAPAANANPAVALDAGVAAVPLPPFIIRGNWTEVEKKTLSEAWVAVSTKMGGLGTGQQFEAFWTKVYDMWMLLNPLSHNIHGQCGRSFDATHSKWRDRTGLNAMCHAFEGKFAQVRDIIKPSRAYENGMISTTQDFYKDCNGGKEFKELGSWMVLRDYPKWAAPLAPGFVDPSGKTPTKRGGKKLNSYPLDTQTTSVTTSEIVGYFTPNIY